MKKSYKWPIFNKRINYIPQLGFAIQCHVCTTGPVQKWYKLCFGDLPFIITKHTQYMLLLMWNCIYTINIYNISKLHGVLLQVMTWALGWLFKNSRGKGSRNKKFSVLWIREIAAIRRVLNNSYWTSLLDLSGLF